MKIIHLSDSHIGKDNQSMGVNTEHHIEEVIQSINKTKTDLVFTQAIYLTTEQSNPIKKFNNAFEIFNLNYLVFQETMTTQR